MARKTQKKPKKDGGLTGLFGSNTSKAKANTSTKRRGQASGGKSGASGSENYLFNLIALVLGLSAIALLAALSSGFSVGASSKPPPNALGDVGQRVSRWLFGTLGATSFLLPPTLAFAGLKIFTSKIPSLKVLQWLGLVLSVLGGMVLGHLFVGEAAGGMVGSIATESLKAFIAPLGAGLVAVAFIIGGLLLATDGALATWTKKALILLWAGLAIALEAIVNFLSWAWAEISEQFSNWRAERAEESERSDREAEALWAEENARLGAIAEAEGFGSDSDVPDSSSPQTRLVLQSKVPASVKPFQSFMAKAIPAPSIPIAGFSDPETAETPASSPEKKAEETKAAHASDTPVQASMTSSANRVSEPPSDEDDADFFAKTKSQIFKDIRAQEQLNCFRPQAFQKTPPPKKALTPLPQAPSALPPLASQAVSQISLPAEPARKSTPASTRPAITSPSRQMSDAPLAALPEASMEEQTEIPVEAEGVSPLATEEDVHAEAMAEKIDISDVTEAPTTLPSPVVETEIPAFTEENPGSDVPSMNPDSENSSEAGDIFICHPVRLPRLNDPPSSAVKAAGLDDFGADDEDDLDGPLALAESDSNERLTSSSPQQGTVPEDESDEDALENEMEEEDQMDGDTSEQAKKDPFVFNKKFRLPPLELLSEPKKDQELKPEDADLYRQTAVKLTEKLKTFHIPGEVRRIIPGPVVTRYEFKPGDGIKVSKIAGLGPDLAMAMEALSVRIIAPIPGRDVVGIEVPNKKRELICLREIFEQQDFQHAKSKLTFAIGKNVEGLPYMTDLAKMPHLLIAGTTGSGKSVTVNAMIMSMLYRATPDEVRMIMVDPKVTELSIYDGIPHLLLPVVTEPKKAAMALQWAVDEMERRYQLLAGASVRNILGYNAWVQKRTEELEAEKKAAEDAEVALRISRKAQEKRAAGEQMSPADSTPPNGEGLKGDDLASEGMDASQLATMIPTSAEEVFGPDMDPSEAKTLPPTASDNLPDAAELPTMVPTPVADTDDDYSAPTMIPSSVQADEEEMLFDRERILSADEESEYERAIAKFLRSRQEEPPQKLPYIVIVIDEVADLMMVVRNEVETHVARLAQKARAAGIHLMMATQRPSADVITGVIKANFPSRISCQLRSWQDSMTILGTKGAEALLGMGDMLILPPDSPNLTRCHGAFVSDEEISDVVAFLKNQGEPNYLDESVLTPPSDDDDEDEDGDGTDKDGRDAKYDEALRLICDKKTISTSKLQRWMQIGYNRAARIIDQMEKDGVVGPANGSKPRQVLAPPLDHHNDLNF